MKKEQLDKSQPKDKSQDSITFMVHKEVKKHLEAGKRDFDLGDVPSALAHYKAALEIDPECALVHFNLGFAFYESRDRDAARRCYQRAIELEPDCSLFLEHQAKLHFESEEYAQAISLFQRASAVGPIQPVSYGLWGRACYELEDYRSAGEQLEKMLRLERNPTLISYARYYLVLSWFREGNLFRARREIEPLLEMRLPDYELLGDLGEQLLDAKCITLARRCLEKFLEDRGDLTTERSYQEIVEVEQRVDRILPRLFSGDEERILQNIHLLFQFGSEKVARALASIQDARSALVREAVIEYHRKYGYPFTGDLERLLNDSTDFVREKSAQYVCQSGDERYTPTMQRLLDDSSPRVRRFAALFLRDVGSMGTLPRLTQALATEDDPENQRHLRLALSGIKMRCEQQRREMIETRLLTATPAEDLEPVGDTLLRRAVGHGIWFALFVLACVVLLLTLLSF